VSSLDEILITGDSAVTRPTNRTLRIRSGDSTYIAWNYVANPNPADVARRVMKDNLAPAMRTGFNRTFLSGRVAPGELKARNTLRDMLSEKEWRRYVTNSFIMVRGSSGRYYQIFQQGKVQVWESGRLTNSICIHTDERCPPTDHVINLKVLVEVDEDAIWTLGYASRLNGRCGFTTIDRRRDLLAEFKLAKGNAGLIVA
jgi:hypothetical protein